MRKVLAMLLGGMLLSSCHLFYSSADSQEVSVPEVCQEQDSAALAALFLQEVAEEIRRVLDQRVPGERYKVRGLNLYSSVLLPNFYWNRSFQPFWNLGASPLQKALEFQAFLEDLVHHGLRPQDYHQEALAILLEEIQSEQGSLSLAYAHLDLLLSDAYFMVAAHLYHGKVDPEGLEASWAIRRDKPELALDKKLLKYLYAGRVEDLFAIFYPIFGGYREMVEEAKLLAARMQREAPKPLSLPQLPIHPLDSLEVLSQIKDQLVFLGWLEESFLLGDSLHFYDAQTVAVVQSLQQSWGLNPDGVIGALTLKALNTPLKDQLETLFVNMERLRWLPRELEERYVLVNIADFSLLLVEKGDTTLSMKTIVGRNYRKTPVFNSTLSYLVFSPTWVVPPTIMRQDVIPAAARDPQYFSSRNMVVLNAKGQEVNPQTIDWLKEGMRYTVRQNPGPQNALGRVKFMFPNKYMVYLHDTPSRALFAQEERTFSSGCIRIEKPLELAALLMADMPGWTPEAIHAAMQQSTERTVFLKSPLGVYLYYLTAWGLSSAHKDSSSPVAFSQSRPLARVRYRADVYGHDGEILKGLRAAKKIN
jgi:L,D-transpeptidase YcbB